MRKVFVLFLVFTSATYTYAEEDDQSQDQGLISLEEAQQIQKAGAGLKLKLKTQDDYGPINETGNEDDSTNWNDQRRFRLYQECAQRRANELSFSGGNLIDRSIGNRLRRNLEENKRNSEDGYESYLKSDNSIGYVRKDPCLGINPVEPDETDERGCVYKLFRGKKSLVQGSCKW